MNKKDKDFINKYLYQILIVDSYENDAQTEDTMEFLFKLAEKTDFDYYSRLDEYLRDRE